MLPAAIAPDNVNGIWIATPSSTDFDLDLLFLNGDAAPGTVGSLFQVIDAPTFSRSGRLAFRATLAMGAGDTTEVAPGDSPTAASFDVQNGSAPGHGVSIDDDGVVTFQVLFQDGRQAILVPEPTGWPPFDRRPDAARAGPGPAEP
jgi:hypothetical protein